MHAYMRMYTQFGCGRSSCYARRGRNGAKGKRACRSACARSRARQSPYRGAGAEGPGARKKRRHPSRFRTMQQQNSISGSKRTARQIKETDQPIRFFWFCFLLIFAAIFAFLMRFFICFLCIFYAFFRVLSAPCGFTVFAFIRYFTYISAYQVLPAAAAVCIILDAYRVWSAAAICIKGADPFLRIFRFPQYSL